MEILSIIFAGLGSSSFILQVFGIFRKLRLPGFDSRMNLSHSDEETNMIACLLLSTGSPIFHVMTNMKNSEENEDNTQTLPAGYLIQRRRLSGSEKAIGVVRFYGFMVFPEQVLIVVLPCVLHMLIRSPGKTFLFSSIVDRIQETLPNAQVVYFYCKHDEPRKTNCNDILRTLIAQILNLNPTSSQYLYDNMIGSVERHPSSTSDLCFNMLEKLAVHHEQLFIGIDGLDECRESERQLILQKIHNILQNSHDSRNIRVFLTSRKEKDIDLSLRSAHRLEIRHYHLEKDIMGYVQVRVQHLSKKFLIHVEHQKGIVADITTRSHGMCILRRRGYRS